MQVAHNAPVLFHDVPSVSELNNSCLWEAMTIPKNIIAVIFGLFVYVGYPQDLETQAKALDLIIKTANSICTTVNTEGSSDSEKVTGAVDAKLNGLIGKLANLGISGDGSYSADHYAGLIREDLPAALKNVDDCKTNVFNKLQPMMIPGGRSNTNQKDASCPSIAGTWYSLELNNLSTIRQNGCEISEIATKNNFYYELTGRAVGDKFEFSDKTTTSDGCIVIYYGRFTAVEEQQTIKHIDHTSGQCGVPQIYSQTETLVRR